VLHHECKFSLLRIKDLFSQKKDMWISLILVFVNSRDSFVPELSNIVPVHSCFVKAVKPLFSILSTLLEAITFPMSFVAIRDIDMMYSKDFFLWLLLRHHLLSSTWGLILLQNRL
jgi:hypothetical protein